MPLLLKKNLYGKNEDIENAVTQCASNKNILYFNNCDELYDEYYKNLNFPNVSVENLKFYNEIYNTTDSLFIFFMDIDVDKNDYDNFSDNINIHENLAYIITKFIKYLIKHNDKNIIIQQIKNKEIYNIDSSAKEEILKNIYITKNKNFKKYSFHIYFSNLVVHENCINNIKNIVKLFKSVNEDDQISKNIDEQVYKNNLSLRILYCKKNKDDEFYHYPIKCIFKKELEIIDEEKELTKENFRNYLFTFDKRKKNYFMINEYISEEEKNLNIISSIRTIDLNESSLTNPYHYFLSLKKIFLMIFNIHNQIEFDYKYNLKNIKFFNNEEKISNFSEKIILEFDYTKYKCIFCNKAEHKNVHVVYIGNVGINVIKEGRSYNCKIRSIPYKNLDSLEICKFIHSKNLVKKLPSEELIIFDKNDGWCLVKSKNNDYSILKKLLLDNEHYFNEYDRKTIHKLSELKLKEHFKSLTQKKDVVNNYYPYLFKFSNGIYNIKEAKFIRIEDSNDLYVINGVDYAYVDEENYSEEQKKDKIFLENVINQIMPEIIDNEINKNRLVFEINLSSCILMARKNVITIFQGETSAGKTTIKNLIVSTLGNNNYIELPISTYTNNIDPNKPNPWLGSIENKRVSFASESCYVDKLNAQTVKLLTEVKILCRNMYSSDIGQVNVLSQFIDTNHTLSLDNPDPASYKRLAIVKFNSHFKNKDNGNFFIPIGENSLIKNNFEEKNNLSEDILNNKYSLIFFNILKNWARKYHLNKIVLKNTSEMSDFCILNHAIINTTFLGYNFNIKNIKESSLNEYRVIKFQTSVSKELETVVCNTSYFKEYFTNFINNKKLDINLNLIISKIKFERKNKNFIPLILFKDIKPNLLEKVIESYNKENKKKTALSNTENLSSTYYLEHKNDFKSFQKNLDSEDEEDPEDPENEETMSDDFNKLFN